MITHCSPAVLRELSPYLVYSSSASSAHVTYRTLCKKKYVLYVTFFKKQHKAFLKPGSLLL